MNLREQIINSAAPYTIAADAELEGRNTFRVAAKANLLIDVRDAQCLPEIFEIPAVVKNNVFVLGEGSNVLFTRDYSGVILSLKTLGIKIVDENVNSVIVRAEGGENWHHFVQWSLGHGWNGLENLSLIPGTVGASPIQNIGAYGVEVGELIHAVDAYDRKRAKFIRFNQIECGFAYRHSIFKTEPERWVVIAVEFRLQRNAALKLDYAGIRDELAAMHVDVPNALQVAEAVCRVRTRKLPNPLLIGNAGSFFKNPIIDVELAHILKQNHPKMPVFPASDETQSKLSAAWLIEQSGWKGFRDVDAGVSDLHSLVLVNYDKAKGIDIAKLALQIRADVEAKYGVRLEAEPIVL